MKSAAPEPRRVLVVRTSGIDMRGFGGFPWPWSGPVEAPKVWNPEWGEQPEDWIGGFRRKRKCGGGLHGLANGEGPWSMLSWDPEAKAIIVETDESRMIRIPYGVKFSSGIVRYVTSMPEALCRVIFPLPSDFAANANRRRKAKVRPTVQASAEPRAQLAARPMDSRLATAGELSALVSSGEGANLVASGRASNLATSGSNAMLAATGPNSYLSASGSGSRLVAAGRENRLAACGSHSVVMAAGFYSQASAGQGGAIAIAWHDGKRPRIATGYVGEDGIKPDTKYEVRNGKLEEVEPWTPYGL